MSALQKWQNTTSPSCSREERHIAVVNNQSRKLVQDQDKLSILRVDDGAIFFFFNEWQTEGFQSDKISVVWENGKRYLYLTLLSLDAIPAIQWICSEVDQFCWDQAARAVCSGPSFLVSLDGPSVLREC